jgi:hypothetical protein
MFSIDPIAGLLGKLIDEVSAEKRRNHEERMKIIAMISDSKLRDAYVHQLLLNQFFLDSSENAQYTLQNAAKHSQWLAEAINYYHQDHGATKEQGEQISRELRLLAVKISKLASLDELKVVYEAATLFTDKLSRFRHREHKYSLEHEIRHGILNPLNDCIAIENNLQRRVALTLLGENINLKFLEEA